MAGCPAVQFEGVTRDRFTCLQQLVLDKAGVALSGDVGTASNGEENMEISWNFDEAAMVLTLEVTESAYPCFLVMPRLKSFVATCLGA
ncbi:MAG TPA: hypothetical protein VGD59_13345 [Acidisarcina sp.]